MNIRHADRYQRSLWVYMAVLALAALGAGLSDSVFSNYFKDAYDVTAMQRGLIEIPRELPGFIGVFIVSLLVFLGDLRIAIMAQALMVIGLVLLGFLTPPFAVMLIFIFIHSLGGHLWYPLQDSLGLHLIRDNGSAGKLIGRFKGVSTAFGMLAGLIVFIGFRNGFFSFTTPLKATFILAAVLFLAVLSLLVYLMRLMPDKNGEPLVTGRRFSLKGRRIKLVFNRAYRYYYALAIVFGVQKQIMMVFAPWVLIDLLGKKADTLALLTIIGSFIGIFFIPALRRWVDRFGIRKMLYVDAFSFIVVYILYGILSAGFNLGFFARTGLPVLFVFALFVIDRMSMQMGLIRSLYLRTIALKPEDIGPTLTLGQSMDHFVSITCAALGGLVWSAWGPQYVFFLAALMSLINYFVRARLSSRMIGQHLVSRHLFQVARLSLADGQLQVEAAGKQGRQFDDPLVPDGLAGADSHRQVMLDMPGCEGQLKARYGLTCRKVLLQDQRLYGRRDCQCQTGGLFLFAPGSRQWPGKAVAQGLTELGQSFTVRSGQQTAPVRRDVHKKVAAPAY